MKLSEYEINEIQNLMDSAKRRWTEMDKDMTFDPGMQAEHRRQVAAIGEFHTSILNKLRSEK